MNSVELFKQVYCSKFVVRKSCAKIYAYPLCRSLFNLIIAADSSKADNHTNIPNNVADGIGQLQPTRNMSTTGQQSSVLCLQEVIALQNKNISNWVIENKIRNLCSIYRLQPKEHKERFIIDLACKYTVNHDFVFKAAQQMVEVEPTTGKVLKVEEKLKSLLTPQYDWLFKNIGRLEMGVKFLVDLRRDVMALLPLLDPKTAEYLAVQQLNIGLRELLTVWFSVGFLKLERVTWNSPCSLLQKISDYEAVHPVRSWVDLKHRVGPYRRCFVYTHSSMPEEPLVVLHIAMTKDIVSSMKEITTPLTETMNQDQANNEQEDPQLVKAFIFYSISSTQKGLQGIELGTYLIRDAAKQLLAEYPHVTMFSTLSPIPTFRSWFIERIKLAEKGEKVFPERLFDKVLQHLQSGSWLDLRKVITNNSWYQDPTLVSLLETPLMVCCSRYLYLEKRRGYAYDSVANFHLRNGAVMWRLNWLADVSPRGLTNSCGLMVNYRYYLDRTEDNSTKYMENQEISVTQQILDLSGGLTSKL